MTAHVVRVGGVWLDGDDLADAMTALEFQVNVLQRNPDGVPVSRRLLRLLDAMREARSASCAPQLSQLAEVVERPELPQDLITVKEAQKLMGTTPSNIRARCARGSVWAVKLPGGEWRLSRSALPPAAETAAG